MSFKRKKGYPGETQKILFGLKLKWETNKPLNTPLNVQNTAKYELQGTQPLVTDITKSTAT